MKLSSFPIQPRKRFGQNFLHDQGIISQIINAINPKIGEHIVEIGPGLGAITQQILPIVKEMDVVELDRDLVPQLLKNCQSLGELTVHQADALKFDFASLAKNKRPLRLVGNLPYNISTPLLFHFLQFAPLIQDIHIMLQKEVVDRLAATTQTSAYGRLSVMVQYYCQVEKLFTVPPSAFTPAPQVYSAIVRLIPYKNIPYLAADEKLLADIVREAFGQRRKTLRNALKKFITGEELTQLNIDPNCRAEELSVMQFVRISNEIASF